MNEAAKTPLTIYFDGACPVCRREIAYYEARTGSDVQYCDVTAEACPAPDLRRDEALRRFHARLPDGRLVSGAAAFVALWERVPGFRVLAPALRLKPVLAVLDLAYDGFLKLRRIWR